MDLPAQAVPAEAVIQVKRLYRMVNLFLSWRDVGRGKGGKRGRISRTAACIIVSRKSQLLFGPEIKYSNRNRKNKSAGPG